MNMELTVQEPVRWWPESGCIQSNPIKTRVTPEAWQSLPDIPEFPGGFITITASESSGKCRFQLWSRETGSH